MSKSQLEMSGKAKGVRRVFAACLAVAMVLSLSIFGGTRAYAEGGIELPDDPLIGTVASGKCGTNLNWKLTSDGLLAISGTGDMYTYGAETSAAPWRMYDTQVSKLAISSGMTTMSPYAFYELTNLTEASLPDTMTTIGAHAFEGCTSLEDISISGSVFIIDIGIDDDEEEIGHEGKSEGEYYLDEAVDQKASVLATVGDSAFAGCSSLTSIGLPASVSTIGAHAYDGCVAIESVTLPTSLSSLGDYAFKGCTALASVTFSGDAPSYIGSSAFEGVTANAYYPKDNATWVPAVMKSYGGTLDWGIKKTSIADADVVAGDIVRHVNGQQAVASATVTIAGASSPLVEGQDYKLVYHQKDTATEAVETAPKAAGFYEVYAQGIGSYQDIVKVCDISLYAQVTESAGYRYRFVSASDSDFVLDVAGVQPISAANVSIWTDNGGLNQMFTLELDENGYYVIRNVANTSLVLDAAGTVPVQGANVSTWSRNEGLNQRWIIMPMEQGGYSIVCAANTSLVLDAAGSEPEIGANVSVWTGNGGANQRWFLQDESDLSTASVSAVGMTRVATGGGLGPDVTVTLNGQTLQESQDYQVVYEGTQGTEYAATTVKPTQPGIYAVSIKGASGKYHGTKAVDGVFVLVKQPDIQADGTLYHVNSKADETFVLDVANVNPVMGSNVSVWDNNKGLNQVFTFELGADGFYVIRNAKNTSLVLDASGTNPKRGANVSTWTENGGLNQKWVIAKSGDSYLIASAYDTGFVLDAAGAEPVRGANVSIYDLNGGDNQLWVIEEADTLENATVEVSGLQRIYTGSALSPRISVTLYEQKLQQCQPGSLAADGYMVHYIGRPGTDYDSYDAPSAQGAYEVWIERLGNPEVDCVYGGLMIINPAAPVEAGAAYRVHSAFVDDENPTDFVLDVANVMPEMGSNVSIWENNNGLNQQFTFELGDDGYYVIRNVANTQLVLDASGAQPVRGANVSTWEENGGLNQKWLILADGDNVYKITSAYDTSFVLDAAGKEPVIGANVSIWTDNGGENQHWTFEKVSGGDDPYIHHD